MLIVRVRRRRWWLSRGAAQCQAHQTMSELVEIPIVLVEKLAAAPISRTDPWYCDLIVCIKLIWLQYVLYLARSYPLAAATTSNGWKQRAVPVSQI